MRKPKISPLLLITVVFTAFTMGFFTGNTRNRDGITVSVPSSFMTVPPTEAVEETEPVRKTEMVTFPISINLAGKEEFMALPGIGEVLAQRIVDYRTENGDFSNPEDLLNVEGIGKKRLEDIMEFITVGG